MNDGLYRKKKAINVKWILIGLAFFVNPNFSVLDVLPDFIGSAFLIAGFYRLAEIDDSAGKARKALMILALTDACKALSMILLTDPSGTVWPLIFTMCFSVGEGALFAYAMWRLYQGITYQAMRRSAERLYTGFSSFVGMSVLVAVLKNLLAILPYLTSLSSDYGTVSSSAASDAEISGFLYTVLMVFNLVAVLSYGIGWWIYMLRYFRAVGNEGEFLESLENSYYEEVGSRNEKLTYRALKRAQLLFFLGVIFMFPLRFDGVDFLPDFLSGIMMCLGILILYPLYRKKCRSALIAGGIYTVLSAAEWIYTLIFNSEVYIGGNIGYYDAVSTVLLHHPEKLPSYFVLVGIGIVKCLSLAVFLWLLARIFPQIIENHTGSPYEMSYEESRQKGMAVKKKLEKQRRAFMAFSLITAGAGIFYRLFRMFGGGISVEYSEAVAVIGLFVATALFFGGLEEGIDNKYFLSKD